MPVIEVGVLIVGGGACGLSSSIFLSDLGIEHLLVERHDGTSKLPKAHYLNQRTMEIFRQHGLAESIIEIGAPLEKFGKVRFQTSLAGEGPLAARLIHEMDAFGGGVLRETYTNDGPILPTNLPQIRLEPLLRSHADQRAPGRVLFGHELVSWTADDDGVRAVVRNRSTGEDTTVLASYLVGADGGKTVGPALGVRLEGPTGLVDVTTAHFSADLSRWQPDGTLITWLINPESAELSGAALVEMGPTWGKESEEWGLHFPSAPDDPALLDETAILPRIRTLLGIPDLEAQLHEVSHWVLEAVLADRYRVGRAFLAGDAAHRHPPATGLGLNTAVQDAHNLAWKLAAVLSGQAGEALLDSYESERRPIGRRNVDWAMSASGNQQVIMDAALGLGAHVPPQMRTPMFFAYFDESPIGETTRVRAAEIFRTHRAECQAHDIEIGFSYAEGAIVPDGSPPPPREPMGDVHHPTTRPGHRLPHAWIDNGDQRVSTHDLTGAGTSFALITGPQGAPWCDAADQVAEKFGVTIKTARIGEGGQWTDTEGRWAQVREIGDAGAVLARPDNHVAWRTLGSADSPVEVLTQAMQAVLAR